MKIFILYVSAGAGHFRAAEAIYNYFEERCEHLKLIDALEKSRFLFRKIYIYGYRLFVTYLPWLWALSFYITSTKFLRLAVKGIRFLINRFNTKELAKFLIQENPDFIISTHFLPAQVCASLKRRQRINSRLITVITDFGVHPFWILPDIDFYIVASDSTQRELCFKGVGEDKVRVLGIPVDLKFLKKYDQEQLCKKIGIEQNKFTLLVATGSFGIGPIEEIVDLLHQEVQILVVCAQNKRLFKRLRDKNYPGVKVFRFIDHIQELMAVSDIIITKPGGLTISEVLVMERVPIFICVIPGQETENVEVLARYGIGLRIEDPQVIKDTVLDYKANPDKLNRIKEKILSIRKPSAVQELYDVIASEF